MTRPIYDLIIVGAGMAGASLAIALRNSNLKIALVEATEMRTHSQPSYDDRGIALTYGSQRIFETMGIWSKIQDHTTAIKTIHVSDRGHFGVTRLSAEHEKVPALGQVITAKILGQTLNKQLSTQENLDIICPVTVSSVQQHDDSVSLTLTNNEMLTTRLLVAADGRDSTIRHYLDMTSSEQQYGQVAVTANVTTDQAHKGMAYERFTASGPLALLPLSSDRSSLVWTVKTGEEDELLSLSDEDFLTTLQQAFGYRAGRFIKVGQRQSYPLTMMQADNPVHDRVVLIGNAAHSLHPIAGQGFNLGLRDVAVLAEQIFNANDCGNAAVLADYQHWRQADQDDVVKSTDRLVKLFSNNISLIAHGRSAGLAIMDCLPMLKHQLAQKSMGMSQHHPKLSRGIPLS